MFLIRLLIVGDTNVGKTSLLLRFNEGVFMPAHSKTTIGVDYKAKELVIDEENVKLQIWDTAGQERFRSMTSAFYNRAQGVVLTFDVSQRSTFNSLNSWLRDINQYASQNIYIVLCANKSDLPVERWEVRREEFENFAHEKNMKLFETSASSGLNVQDMFMSLGREIMRRSKTSLAEQPDEKAEALVLFDQKNQKSKKRWC